MRYRKLGGDAGVRYLRGFMAADCGGLNRARCLVPCVDRPTDMHTWELQVEAGREEEGGRRGEGGGRRQAGGGRREEAGGRRDGVEEGGGRRREQGGGRRQEGGGRREEAGPMV